MPVMLPNQNTAMGRQDIVLRITISTSKLLKTAKRCYPHLLNHQQSSRLLGFSIYCSAMVLICCKNHPVKIIYNLLDWLTWMYPWSQTVELMLSLSWVFTWNNTFNGPTGKNYFVSDASQSMLYQSFYVSIFRLQWTDRRRFYFS